MFWLFIMCEESLSNERHYIFSEKKEEEEEGEGEGEEEELFKHPPKFSTRESTSLLE
jgi:hypothetical protein